jgi:N-carbamoyl-L-amino-acid hydrolase
MAALGVLRAWAGAEGKPSRAIAFVDWADEEGARFGRSLFGSSAAAGTFDPAELANARDSDGRRAPGVLAENGVDLERVLDCRSRLDRIDSYLELHIEQGPVLEAEGIRAAAVSGCAGVERIRFVIQGRAAHAGTTPMGRRHDPGLVAAETALRIEEIAKDAGGVGTVGDMEFDPGIPTAVPGNVSMLVDLRHREPEALASMLASARDAVSRGAAERGCELAEEPIWRIEPISFDPELVAMARDACEQVTGTAHELSSGALHDAASMAPHVPTAMIFSPSIGGVSHAQEEDTAEADLTAAIESFGALASLRLT